MIRTEDMEPNVLPFVFYVEAFKELSTCRSSGFDGSSPIPFTAIVDYAKIYQVEDLEDFLYIIRCMDSAYLEKEKPKDVNKSSKNTSSSSRRA